jgi:carboxyl-terminal processing protease
MSFNKKEIQIYLPIILGLTLIGGIILGNILSKESIGPQKLIPQKENKINQVSQYIQSNYVDTIKEQVLVEAAIPAMLKELDPHSVYIPAKKLQEINEPLKGNFEGIGIQFNMQKDTIIVVSTITGGPSEKAGLMAGDRIIKVNDTVVAGVDMPSSKIVKMLKGDRGTKVDVSIKRKNYPKLLDFTITRDKIPIYSVDVAYMVDSVTGYIKIDRFARTTYREFIEGIKKLKEKSVQNLVLDLRGNSGGYMNAATSITDQFLKEDNLIVYTKGKASPKREIYATSKGLCQDVSVVVLIDEWSASASEILAGAIQDNDRGIIVGRRSFGKGLVQEQIRLSDGSAIRLTVARYHTPTGRSIQKPYNKGREQYYSDISKRFKHGEFFDADSINFADSLKYTTPKGDTVYGGGGIMPDYFVPIDTTYHSKFLSKITNRNLIYRFSFDYADNQRTTLKKFTKVTELNNYLKKKNLYSEFLSFVKQEGISTSVNGVEKSKKLIDTRIRAYIARNIMDNEGFYPVLNELDKSLKKAIELIKKEELN